MKTIIAFLRDERGMTAVEYGLIATGLVLAIITALTTTGTSINGKLTTINTALK